MESKSQIFEGALPYAPDLAKLDMEFPNLKPLDRIEYKDIGRFIHAEWPSGRFMGVLEAWRKRLKKSRSLHTACEPSKALLILTAEQAMCDYNDKYKKHGRGIGRQSRNLLLVEREDLPTEDSKKQLDHSRFVVARTAAAFMGDNKELSKSWTAPALLPKPHLVKPKD